MLNILELYLSLVSKSCQIILCSGHCLKLSLLLLPLSSHAQNIKILSLLAILLIFPQSTLDTMYSKFKFLKSHYLFCFLNSNPQSPIACMRNSSNLAQHSESTVVLSSISYIGSVPQQDYSCSPTRPYIFFIVSNILKSHIRSNLIPYLKIQILNVIGSLKCYKLPLSKCLFKNFTNLLDSFNLLLRSC